MVSNDASATTTYAYSLTSPSWTDPTGTYLVTLDAFDRQASLDDPATSGTWTFAYRADGQPTTVTPPSGYGSATASTYDAVGRLTGLATTNAAFTHTLNRAANRLSENAQVSGDPQNGSATFAFDPLGRLTGYTLPGIRTLGAAWQGVPNRDSLTTDGTPVTTTFDAANRPTSSGFAADLDGRLTAIPARGGAPAKSLGYDALGRLVSATVAGVTRTYAYDPLDRLVTVSEGGVPVTRFRYVGQTGSVAQLLDGAFSVTRNVGTDWSGAALADWAPGGSGWRRYIANGHGDLVATADASGAVTTSLRLDPWGVPLRAVPAGYPAFGFQGSLTDRSTTLVYARARWYDPVLATFTSEDPIVGEAADPPSRHLYAYGAGDPVDRADPSGLFWYRVRAGDTLAGIAASRNLKASEIRAGNPGGRITPRSMRLYTSAVRAGDCIWIPWRDRTDTCDPYPTRTYHDYAGPLYWRYDAVLSFIYGRMMADRKDGAGGVGRWSDCPLWLQWCQPLNLGLLASFALKVRGHGDWDYKYPLIRRFGRGESFHTPIRGDPAPELLYFDVWTNIHFGYVGRAHGIPADILHAGAEQFGGARSVSDWVSNEIGIQLWNSYRTGLTKPQLARTVLQKMDAYRNDPTAKFQVIGGLVP